MPVLPVDTQRWLPWKETVALTSVRPNSADVTETVEDAGVYRLGESEAAPSRGVHTKYDVKITLATGGVAFAPKPRDRALWLGDTYTVLSVERSDWTRHYVLTARNLILAADLRQAGDLKRPSNAQDAAGRQALGTYSTVAAAVPCRVQPEGGEATVVVGRRTIPKHATAYLGQQVEARAKDVFVCGGVTYTVLGYQNPERIDELMSLKLEAVP